MKESFFKNTKRTAYKLCHRIRGNRNGNLTRGMEPPPRNFTRRKVMEGLPVWKAFLDYPQWFKW